MSRDDGFTVMDVATNIHHDPKIRKLWRYAPDHAGAAFFAYVATVGESWLAGRRVSIDDAWPADLPFSKAAVEALVHVGLIDRNGFVPPKAWRSWFGKAKERRDVARDRWRRSNEKRHADAALSQRGNDAVTASTVPTVPSVPPEGFTGTLSDTDQRARGPVLVHPERTA